MPPTIARVFLAFVGLLYLALAIWCSIAPNPVSQKVGFTLNGDSGRSEFITVYGGLEFGLALLFLLPLLNTEATRFSLLSCILIHGSLVAFRSASLLLNRGFGSTTGKLAVGEWVILLLASVVWFASRKLTES